MLCGLLPLQVSEGSYGQLTLTVIFKSIACIWHGRQDCRKWLVKHDLVCNFSHQHSVEPAAKCVHWIGEAQQQTY